jgi:hypothetical protein
MFVRAALYSRRIAIFEAIKYRTLSSQENIWDTEQREQ